MLQRAAACFSMRHPLVPGCNFRIRLRPHLFPTAFRLSSPTGHRCSVCVTSRAINVFICSFPWALEPWVLPKCGRWARQEPCGPATVLQPHLPSHGLARPSLQSQFSRCALRIPKDSVRNCSSPDLIGCGQSIAFGHRCTGVRRGPPINHWRLPSSCMSHQHGRGGSRRSGCVSRCGGHLLLWGWLDCTAGRGHSVRGSACSMQRGPRSVAFVTTVACQPPYGHHNPPRSVWGLWHAQKTGSPNRAMPQASVLTYPSTDCPPA